MCVSVCVCVCVPEANEAGWQGEGGYLSSVQSLSLFPGGELHDKPLDPKDHRQEDLSRHDTVVCPSGEGDDVCLGLYKSSFH